jgi:hypothetical protein
VCAAPGKRFARYCRGSRSSGSINSNSTRVAGSVSVRTADRSPHRCADRRSLSSTSDDNSAATTARSPARWGSQPRTPSLTSIFSFVRSVRFWDPALNPPVNKRDLSTGENGEFRASRAEKAGFTPYPKENSFQTETHEITKIPAKCWGYRRRHLSGCCQLKGPWQFATGRTGSANRTNTLLVHTRGHSLRKIRLQPH